MNESLFGSSVTGFVGFPVYADDTQLQSSIIERHIGNLFFTCPFQQWSKQS